MELNNDLITQFAKITKFNPGKSATTVRGTIQKADDENARPYLVIDGAEEGSKTPVDTVVEVADGDRVIATVKDHSVIVTGNKTNPAIGKKTADGLRSEITQTASEIRAEVADEVSGLNSTITQTASEIRTEVADEVSGLNSKITQTANTINQRIDNLNAVDGEEFTEFKQTVEGFYFTDEDGTVYIDGGSVYAKNLNLTGSIVWDDFDEGVQDEIEKVAKGAAGDAQVVLPDYIKSTYIDFTTVKSPYIIGGYLYAVGTDPGDTATFTTMDENGFYLYHNSVIPDEDNVVYPKIALTCSADGEDIYCVLGSGAADDSSTFNRFYIKKTSQYVSLQYVNDYNGNYVGFDLFRSGQITINADTIRGYGGVFPIGYIYLSYDDSISPASLFGGSWTRLNGYFLYAGGSSATMGDTGSVVTAGGTNSATYIKIAAWRRTA